MKQLLAPNCTPEEAYMACTSAIIDDQQRDRMRGILPSIRDTAAEFIERVAAGSTWELPYLRLTRGEDPFVIDDIRKSELVHLYEYYMVKREPGRALYDSILVAAGDHCPTCGGIGQPRTLDHYLPKANYPKLAIVPQNLIPACRDCNTDKRNPLIDHPHQQLLHPYLDKRQFFEERWISVSVSHTTPCTIIYFASPPDDWSDEDKARVANHFSLFAIAERYSVQAGSELGFLMDMQSSYFSRLPPEAFSDFLRSGANAAGLLINGWKKVLYEALADDPWFCNAGFRQ
ncbi:HNH endonuclease [Pseudomonas extremorientalis]|uniref:HNH endonuclease n=1 Tax=Pseudomonas extremorientalis TaxID=169669 RepID=UPI002736703F|nr:HNH endonuclease [Pseudomonas extremorientalis]WLG59609.1 HNH endonuclease [Pseudomonas extremorientalis]